MGTITPQDLFDPTKAIPIQVGLVAIEPSAIDDLSTYVQPSWPGYQTATAQPFQYTFNENTYRYQMVLNASFVYNGPQDTYEFWGVVCFVNVGPELEPIYTFDLSGTAQGFINQGETIFTIQLGLTIPPPLGP